ncbi:arylamine N-acetyltransferase family protein [Lentisalinibacter sediminis]|uniref:arylamine N-acetyltransferase family protein n=1 Tax=Lentisalinibacter sediminis TaxID=2992237 RepID=UPI00386E6980
MHLQPYLDRIGYPGPVTPTLATLRALLRHHALAVPFENLDVQLGRRLTLDPGAAFDKIVHNKRGGWCYEQNGLFGAVLATIGFGVTRIAGAVMREGREDISAANHLALLIETEDALARRCDYLQSDPTSGFVRSLVAQIRLPDAHRTLRGRVLSEIGPRGSEERLIDSADDLLHTLARQFHLDVPEVRDLWPRIVERHEEFMRGQAADDQRPND